MTHCFQTLPYPQGLPWPLAASSIAALHPQLVQAPFADPTFYVVTGLEPSGEKRYRSWARPVARKQTVMGLALTAGVHACLGRGLLALEVATETRPLSASQIRFVAASNTNEVSGAVERQLLNFAGRAPCAPFSDTLRALVGSARSVNEWLDGSALRQHPANEQTLLAALTLASSLVSVYLSGLDYALSTEPDTTLGGVLEVMDQAILDAVNGLSRARPWRRSPS